MARSWDSERSIGAPGGSGGGPSAPHDSARQRRRILGRGLLVVWALASLAWTASVMADFYYRACNQADMSAEIDRDLDTVACAGPGCMGTGTAAVILAPQEDWTKVASTYLHFGYVDIIEWAALPPMGLLAICIGSSALRIRRRRPDRKSTRLNSSHITPSRMPSSA